MRSLDLLAMAEKPPLFVHYRLEKRKDAFENVTLAIYYISTTNNIGDGHGWNAFGHEVCFIRGSLVTE